jgi:hypothetical protein
MAKMRKIAVRHGGGARFRDPRCEGLDDTFLCYVPRQAMKMKMRWRVATGAPFRFGAKVILEGPQVRTNACLATCRPHTRGVRM